MDSSLAPVISLVLKPQRLMDGSGTRRACLSAMAMLAPVGWAFATTPCVALHSQDFESIPDAPTFVELSEPMAATTELPGYCRVQGYVQKRVRFELRLPERNEWNGKLFMQGCRAYCGEIHIDKANDALARGYATLATDMGHAGTILDAGWAYNDREAEIDYAFRATHVVAVAAKQIVRAWSGAVPARAYFRGCSTGGRQGLIEAARFPDDFDGIVAGAPVAPKSGALDFYWTSTANLDAEGNQILKPADLDLIHRAVLEACDFLDGRRDGVLDDPRECTFEPAVLACGSAVAEGPCLTHAKIGVLRRLYQGPVNAAGQRLTAGGHLPGGELNWLGMIVGRENQPGLYLALAEENFRYLAFAEDPGPTYNVDQFDLDIDPPRMDFMAHISTGFLPDMRGYRDRGGKLILYHGWQDGPAFNTLDFYELATRTMGGEAATRDFFRLFMVPGMNHCGGGPGPNSFDFITAIEAWTERGKAPDRLLGAHLDDDGRPGDVRWVSAYASGKAR